MAQEQSTNAFGRLMEELAASRGLTLEELAQEASATGHTRRRITAEGLRGEDPGPPMGYGNALDAVLELSPGERERVPRAFMASFMDRRTS